MKKLAMKIIIIPIVVIGIIIGTLAYISGYIWVKQQTQIISQVLFKSFKSEVIAQGDSFDLQKKLDPVMNNFVKNLGVAYLIVVENSGDIAAHSNKKEARKPYKDKFLTQIITQQKLQQRKIKQAYDDVFEFGEPIHIKDLDGAIIMGISTNNATGQLVTLVFIIISGFTLLVITSFAVVGYLDKMIFSSIGRLEQLGGDIVSGKEIAPERYLINKEMKGVTDCLEKVSIKLSESAKNIEKYITDSNTGFYSFQYMIERLSHELDRARRYKRSMSCILLDLSNWQNIFTLCGLTKSEFALLELAGLMKSNLRSVDLKGKMDRASFIFILPEINTQDAMIVAERLVNMVKQYKIHHEKQEINFTASIGINSFILERTGINGQEFIEQCEKVMNIARTSGENQIRTF